MRHRCRLLMFATALFSVGCTQPRRPETSAKPRLLLTQTQHRVGGHLPPQHRVTLSTTPGTETDISEGVYLAVLGPDAQVAFVDDEGLKLWERGETRRVASAQPRGLGAGPSGVAFTSAAQRGLGTGVSLLRWDGTVLPLLAAPEGLEDAAGYHTPSLSPSGRYVVVFSDLTPRPSLYRVSVASGAVQVLSSDAPPVVGEPWWVEETLHWSTGDGEASLDVVSGEVHTP